MVHAVRVTPVDYLEGSLLEIGSGRGIRKWLRGNVSTRWRMGDFAVEFQDETDATMFKLWYGECVSG